MTMTLNRSSKDSGLAWLALIGAFIANFMYGTMSRAFGELYVILLERFHGSDLATSGVGALNLLVVGAAGPIAAWVSSRISYRLVGLIGAVIVAVGFLFTGFAQSLALVYVWYGIVLGLGMSLTYVCSFLVVNSNFDRLKATAMALAVTGNGLGCFVFPPILEVLYASYGFQVCLICLASVSALLFLNVIFYRRPGEPVFMPGGCLCSNKSCSSRALLDSTQSSDTEMSTDLTFSDDLGIKKKLKRSPSSDSALLTIDTDDDTTDSSYWQLLKEIPILALLLQNLTVQAALSFCAQYTPAFAIDQGIDPLYASFLLSASGVSSALGPLVISAFLDIEVCRPHLLTVINCVVAFGSVLQMLTPLPTEFAGLMGIVVLKAGSVGLLLTQRATVAAELAGSGRIAAAMGLALFAEAIGSLIGRTTGGAFKDKYGGYDAGFYMTGGLCFFGCILFQIAMRYRQKR